ncbi:MAG: HPr family phosphocarrier protein [Candidatus Omnitrophota bacterium]
MEVRKEIIVKNRTGLHARPAAIFVQTANKYDSDITITKEDQEVNGKSIMGILMLAAEKGANITIIAKGDDAEEAVAELSEVLLHDIEPDVVN